MTELFRRIRDYRVLHFAVAILSVVAGLFYLVFPPVTTIGFFEGSWPPRTWGAHSRSAGSSSSSGSSPGSSTGSYSD